ncbi:MAG: gluconate 2-dehydrogenase subunit 3 family protein [Acidobacteriaceae bacterium]|nr:gluconate 2-dehydrogenase subunit 3 family protein [Acidobacteriaceae bacterium]MBV9767834.1 gluconate 2-dehydrogenase subunit 3 family protein [Acidobacteriaceae bacterium]
MDANLNRRDLFKVLTAAAFTTLQLPAAEPGAPLFFTKDEFALLDALTDLIVPTDAHSPGAHEAGVAQFIDRSVAEAFLPEDKTSWRKGLASVNELSRSMYQMPFLKSSKQQQIQLLTGLAAKEKHPQTAAEKFFTQVKETTAFVYYSSSIGIHQETQYKGNVLLEQFVGYDAT